MEPNELEALASQLKQPSGDKGIQVAAMMNDTNIGMTKHAIKHLQLQPNDSILELGHGNGGHIEYLLAQQPLLRYTGLEISPLMQQQAQKINSKALAQKQVNFSLYNGTNIPFEANQFSKIFTVNTIYFWQQPQALLNNLYAVMQPGGSLVITFALASFMSQLPFTQYHFKLYNIEDVEKLVATTQFKTIAHVYYATEQIKSKSGEMVNREFATVVLIK